MEKFKRLENIINIINRNHFISKQGIIDYFDNHFDFQLSTRTLERDFQSLENDFHIEIRYDRANKGYHLVEEDKPQISSFLSFAGRMYLASLYKRGLQDFEDLQKSVKLEDYSHFTGLDFVEPIFLAIKNHQLIEFNHENYLKATKKQYIIAPFQLKEYQGRWYVIGVPIIEDDETTEKMHIKIFGLDRISQYKTGSISNLNVVDFQHQLEKFEQIVGLNFDEGEKQEIIELAVTENQYKYLESLPIHASQLKKDVMKDGRIKVTLYLIPNYELKMQLLKYGDQIEVLSPFTLRNEIKTILENSIKNYDDEK